jgi:DNA invertase Pin-like site-specific DNA recombinase
MLEAKFYIAQMRDAADLLSDRADLKGADAIDARPGFATLLDRIEGNGVRTVIVEDASRFARSSWRKRSASRCRSSGAS